MPASGAARREPYLSPPFSPTPVAIPVAAADRNVVSALAWAVGASTWHRIRRGEGAVLAVNLSLILLTWRGLGFAVMQALVSTLAILLMYAFNDLYDAPVDANNPKKNRDLIATWLEYRRVDVFVTFALKIVTLGIAMVALGPLPTAAVAAVMIVNVVYSTLLKGVPIADIVAVFLWGLLFAAIVDPAPVLIVLVGLMTGVCHLFQALDDRDPDAANGIMTTAVRSLALSRNALIVLSVLCCALLWSPLGVVGALTAFTPLLIFFVVRDAGTGWLLTKGYYGLMWLYLLWTTGAAS
jgi:4-hydroxybenzoate polyprenyltransferase